MACMDIKTFDIYHNDQCIIPNGYVEIDELIAPSIQILNLKGYITEWCCSGHALKDELLRNNSETGYEVIINGKQPDGSFRYSRNACYISFKENISLPSLPHGFTKDSNSFVVNLVIRGAGYSPFETDFFKKSLYILETMKQLYEWALNLPEFINE